MSDADLRSGEVTVVNFWASWCPPCRAEHPKLLELQAEGVRIVGVNYKDRQDDAAGYLTEDGSPFVGVAYDPQVPGRGSAASDVAHLCNLADIYEDDV